MVTKLLEQAMTEAAKLPENDQEEIAQFILDEIADRRSKKTPRKPSLSLREMIDQTRRDIEEGKTQELDPDNL